MGFRTPLNLLTFPCVDRSPLRPNQSYRGPAEMYPRRHERGAAMATNSRPTAWCQPSAAPGGVVDSAGRSAPPHGATAKGGGVGNSAAWSKDSCRTGRAAVGQLAVAASPFSRRAPLSKICSTAELKPAPRYSGRYRRCRRRVPCITASVQRTQLDPVVLYRAFHQSARRHKELFGLGLRRIQCCDRFGVLAVLHRGARFPNRHGGFPVLTAAALRHLVRPLDAGPPAHADAD